MGGGGLAAPAGYLDGTLATRFGPIVMVAAAASFAFPGEGLGMSSTTRKPWFWVDHRPHQTAHSRRQVRRRSPP